MSFLNNIMFNLFLRQQNSSKTFIKHQLRNNQFRAQNRNPARIQHKGKPVRLNALTFRNDFGPTEYNTTGIFLSITPAPAIYRYNDYMDGSYEVDKNGYLLFRFSPIYNKEEN